MLALGSSGLPERQGARCRSALGRSGACPRAEVLTLRLLHAPLVNPQGGQAIDLDDVTRPISSASARRMFE